MSNPLADMDKPDVIFCIGTNMTECHPVAATRLKRALAGGAKMIVADPRHIGLVDHADLYLPLRVGSDVALLLAMAHVIDREGLTDPDFMAARTVDGEKFLEHVKRFTPEWAEEITGIPAKDIEAAAWLYGNAERGAVYYTLGITEHICGVDSRTQTGRSAGIDYLLPEEVLEVHPEDVKAWDLKDGGWCQVTSPRGSIEIKVKATR